MRASNPFDPSSEKGRLTIIFIVCSLLFLMLLVRIVIIQVFPSSAHSLQKIAQNQYNKTIKLAPYRGTIYDHRRSPLAVSIKTPSIAINPRVFDPSTKKLRKLSKILNISKKQIREKISKKKYFAWLKRKIDREQSEAVKKLDLKGLHFLWEPARFYPGGRNGSNLVGYVGIDDVGLLGIEHAFESQLRGEDSKVLRLKDARGHPLYLNADLAIPQQLGNNLVLTIDSVIQEITQEALTEGAIASQANNGFAIVADPHTGRILSIANYPNFDPNNPKNLKISNTQNHAISKRFEPGSVMKPFVIAAWLDKKMGSVQTEHNCEESGVYKLKKGPAIHDDHPHKTLTTQGILVRSSNICTYKIAKALTPEGLWNTFRAFGFNSRKNLLGLPGESSGYISHWLDWKEIRFANISFGQGMLVTGLEIIQAYSILANGGSLLKPYIIEKTETPSGEILSSRKSQSLGRVISYKTAKLMKQILKKVVTDGTGKLAKPVSYSAAGKTGTAEKVDPLTKAYSRHKRIANFAGFAPVEDPHIVVYVVLDEPNQKPYYGGKWAAPVFSKIAEKTLKYLNVEPSTNPDCVPPLPNRGQVLAEQIKSPCKKQPKTPTAH